MTRALLVMAERMAGPGITRMVMEATSDYWKPVFYLLEAAGLETWLVNAAGAAGCAPTRDALADRADGLPGPGRRSADGS